MHNHRRVSDRRTGMDRRRGLRAPEFPRTPTWEEQRTQHLTRFLFWAFALIYFNVGAVSEWFTPLAVTLYFLCYGVYNALSLWHARRELYSPLRWRVSMWVDIATCSVAVLADPLIISPPFFAETGLSTSWNSRHRRCAAGFHSSDSSLVSRYP